MARQAAQDAFALAQSADPPDAALVAELQRQLSAADAAHHAVLEAIEQHGGQLAALVPSRNQSVRSVAEVQDLLDPQTTLVSFFVTDRQTLAFVLTRDTFTTVALQTTRAALAGEVRALRAFANLEESLPVSAQQLYKLLFLPLKPLITTQHLAIVPHDILHYVPFAALGANGRFVLDDHTLSVLPSASTLFFIQQNKGRPAAAPLVLGDPATNDPQLRPLAFAEQEARTVAEVYGVAPLLGAGATAAGFGTVARPHSR